MDTSTNRTAPVRRVLGPDELHRIHAVIRDAADTGQLLTSALGVLYDVLSTETDTDPESEAGPIDPGRYAIPSSQWQVILAAMTRRAEAWGTAAEVGLELVMNLMPGYYDDPQCRRPTFRCPTTDRSSTGSRSLAKQST